MLVNRNLTLFFFMLVFNLNFGQNYLDKKVTLSENNQAFSTVFKKISTQTGVVFSYTNFNDQQRLTYSCEAKKLSQVLNEILPDSYIYSAKGKYIILKSGKKTSTTPIVLQKTTVSGKIIDAQTKEPIEHVSIYIKSSKNSVLTKENGTFSLTTTIPSEGLVLNIAKFQYVDTLILIENITKNTIPEIQLRRLQLNNKTSAELETQIPKKLTQKELLKFKLDSLENVIDQRGKAFWNRIKMRNENFKNINDTLFSRNAFSFVPPLSTNKLLGLNTINRNAFHVLIGQSKGIENFEFAGLANIDAGDVQYFQFAGLANIVKGNVNGFQLAGVTNINSKHFTGVQIGGMYNHQRKQFNGIQIGGITNYVQGNFTGIQLAGISNVNVNKTSGIQLAGISNYSDTLFGFQMSGILNQASYIRGLQVGFINVSQSIEGTPIGFFSYSKTGYHKFEFAYDDLNMSTIAFRTGVNHFHNIFFAGAETNQTVSHVTAGYGLGSALRLSKRFFIGIDATGQTIQSRNSNNWNNTQILSKMYLGLEYRLTEKVNFFGGPTFNLLITDQNATNTWMPPNVFLSSNSGNINLKTWVGFKIGMRFW